jgi:ankyrin repeat protein
MTKLKNEIKRLSAELAVLVAEQKKLDDWGFDSASNGKPRNLAKAIKAGFDPNERSPTGMTPMRLALVEGSASCVKVLLGAGVDADEVCARGESPLRIAATLRHAECVEALLGAGADASRAWSGNGLTPLMSAVIGGEEKCVVLILDKGVDLEAKDISGKTALIFAACFGHAGCLELLIKAGADLSAKDHEGKTALACARNFIRNFPKEKSGPIVKGMLEAEFERRALARSVRAKASLKKASHALRV